MRFKPIREAHASKLQACGEKRQRAALGLFRSAYSCPNHRASLASEVSMWKRGFPRGDGARKCSSEGLLFLLCRVLLSKLPGRGW